MRALTLIVLALSMPACKKLEPKATQQAAAERQLAQDRRIRQACASQASYERLKTLIFEKAGQVRTGNAATLDNLAGSTVVRMEEPVVKSRDEQLNVTVCTGRMIIELPPGAEDVFNGERRLVADVEYAAQAAADGSGMVYQLDGAEPIIYRLAAIDLKGAAPPVPVPTPVAVAEAPSPRSTPEPRASAVVTPTPRATPAVQRSRVVQTRPSFNCRYARSRTEQMVCTDERLAALDREMASLYYQAVAVADPGTRRILRGSRDRFLSRRERCGGPDCVAASYEDRIDEIDRIMSDE